MAVTWKVAGQHELDRSLDAYLELDGGSSTIEVEVQYARIGGATPAAAFYVAALRATFGNIPVGIVAVRNIAGTSQLSQHAFGNAVDAMTGTNDALRHDIAFWADANRGPLSIAHLLADPWFPSPRSDHWGHVHADFFPQYGGTPPGHPI